MSVGLTFSEAGSKFCDGQMSSEAATVRDNIREQQASRVCDEFAMTDRDGRTQKRSPGNAGAFEFGW
jgi:hypothetical protein